MEFDLSKKYCFYFNEISRIPRGSRNEKAVSDYVVAFAKEHGLHYIQDDTWNVIVDVPASPGYENSGTVLLQAHMGPHLVPMTAWASHTCWRSWTIRL